MFCGAVRANCLQFRITGTKYANENENILIRIVNNGSDNNQRTASEPSISSSIIVISKKKVSC